MHSAGRYIECDPAAELLDSEVAMFPLIYKYFIGIGLMLFGVFALKFPEYQHPIYGYINLGKYRIIIGVASVLAGAFYTYHITNRKNK
jgi:hypothetical protein